MKTRYPLTVPISLGLCLALAGCDAKDSSLPDEGAAETDADADSGEPPGDAGDPPQETGDDPDPSGDGTTGEGGESGEESSTGETGESDGEAGSTGGDEPGPASECDPWNASDCPDGFKCMPYDEPPIDLIWDANGCFPVSPQGHVAGDECTVFDSAVDGIDSCNDKSMCLPYDFEDLNAGGTCVAFCEGASDAPNCASATDTCVIANDGVLNLCLTMCDPILQNCGEGEGCYLNLTDGKFFCFAQDSDAAEADSGYEAPCGTINYCDPGLQCGDGANVPSCDDAYCCTEYCDLTDALGDRQCSGYEQGQVCTAHFPEGEEPPGFEHVGLCAVPQ